MIPLPDYCELQGLKRSFNRADANRLAAKYGQRAYACGDHYHLATKKSAQKQRPRKQW